MSGLLTGRGHQMSQRRRFRIVILLLGAKQTTKTERLGGSIGDIAVVVEFIWLRFCEIALQVRLVHTAFGKGFGLFHEGSGQGIFIRSIRLLCFIVKEGRKALLRSKARVRGTRLFFRFSLHGFLPEGLSQINGCRIGR